jgi:hypothetical protein
MKKIHRFISIVFVCVFILVSKKTYAQNCEEINFALNYQAKDFSYFQVCVEYTPYKLASTFHDFLEKKLIEYMGKDIADSILSQVFSTKLVCDEILSCKYDNVKYLSSDKAAKRIRKNETLLYDKLVINPERYTCFFISYPIVVGEYLLLQSIRKVSGSNSIRNIFLFEKTQSDIWEYKSMIYSSAA